MPPKLDSCVDGLLSKWGAKPGSAPKKTKDGHPIKTPADRKSAAFAICRASTKLEETQEALLLASGGLGPALIAAAVTAKPHLRQRGQEITIVTRDDKKLVRVPLFRQGVYRHPQGELVFNSKFFQRIIENHNNKVTDYNVHLDFRHGDDRGALAFLDKDDGGFLEIEDGWLVAYGPPTDEKAEEIIKSRKWRYASAQFNRDYKSNLKHKLSSSEELFFLEAEDLLALTKEKDMPQTKDIKFGDLTVKVGTQGEEDKEEFVLTQDLLDQIQEAMTAVVDSGKTLETKSKAEADKAGAKIVTLEGQISDLKEKLDSDNGDDELEGLPEAARKRILADQVRLEAAEKQIALGKDRELRQKVAFSLSKAAQYRDENGRGHSPIFLNLVEAGLLGRSFSEGDVTVTLEGETEKDLVAFYRNLLVTMLEKVPGQMAVKGKTKGEDNPLDDETLTYTEEEMQLEVKEFEKY